MLDKDFIIGRDKPLHLGKAAIVMGILNVTPDSFYDGGRYAGVAQALTQVEQMLSDGTQIIDVGGMSSRPGAKVIGVEEEKRRVLEIIRGISKEFPKALISIDTVRSEVARAAIGEGASWVNDISAGSLDDRMYETVAELDVPYVLMHMQGRPETMQDNPLYTDVGLDVLDFFIKEVSALRRMGVKDIIVDPGFGFGKSLEDNYRLLSKLPNIEILECPVLVGVSRKSMIYKPLGVTPAEALDGTNAIHFEALRQGARILRVHDVLPAIQAIELFAHYRATC